MAHVTQRRQLLHEVGRGPPIRPSPRISFVRLEKSLNLPGGRARRGAGRFLGGLEARGLTELVLVVAMMSEFGRRPELNGRGGLDHGTASAALLAGAVSLGRIGKPLGLNQLDEDDNFVATIPHGPVLRHARRDLLWRPRRHLLRDPPRPPVGSRTLSLRLDVRRAQNQCAASSALT